MKVIVYNIASLRGYILCALFAPGCCCLGLQRYLIEERGCEESWDEQRKTEALRVTLREDECGRDRMWLWKEGCAVTTVQFKYFAQPGSKSKANTNPLSYVLHTNVRNILQYVLCLNKGSAARLWTGQSVIPSVGFQISSRCPLCNSTSS